MKDVIVVVIDIVVTESAKDGIRSKSSTRSYDEGWERTFGKRQPATSSKELN